MVDVLVGVVVGLFILIAMLTVAIIWLARDMKKMIDQTDEEDWK